VIVAIAALSSAVAAQRAITPPNAAGAELYAAACAACHGTDGRGSPQPQVGFHEPLPDFTDCSFASPETGQDWGAIVHQGGPVRAFSRRMPRFGAALTEPQIERVVEYIRSLCTDRRWPPGELNLPRPIATEKAFPEKETVFTSEAVTRSGSRYATVAMKYERRFGIRNQIEVAIPMTTLERSAADGGGWFGPRPSDIAVALKTLAYHDAARGSILSLYNELALPTGDETLGFGSGTPIVESMLLAGQLLPFNSFVQLQTGVEIPFDKVKAEREAVARAALGTTVGSAFGRAWSPMVELLAARELKSGEQVSWDVIPQMQVTVSKRQHIAFSFGMQFPLGDRTDRPPRLMAYLLWDWADGGFFEGWR
jgi:mono/diheme cytochrome c family protein